jgi:hypothetical protein
MRRVIGRLDKVEKTLGLASGPPPLFRLIVTRMDNPGNPPTCKRTLQRRTPTEPGALTEIVTFYGCCDHLSSDHLENFIQSFPIEEIGMGTFGGSDAAR